MKRLLFIISICFTFNSIGQNINAIYFHLDKKTEKYRVKSDSFDLKSIKLKYLNLFTLTGYIDVAISDSLVKKKDIHYQLIYSEHFKHVVISNNSSSINTTVANTYSQINKKIISLENNGFPFASIQFTDQSIKQKKLHLTYKIDSGQYIIIDKIHLKSEDKFNTKTILNLIGIAVGSPYNESKLKKINKLINVSGLYKTIRPPAITFTKGKAEVYLYFKKVKSSSADGYVGLVQDKNTQKLSLNGYVNLHLKNSLNRAELINLNWKSNPDKTQNLKFNFAYPYVFNTPFGVETDLNLHKQDTSFVKSLANFGINYNQPFYQFGVFTQIENSSIINTTNLYSIRNFTKNTIGLKLVIKPQFNNLLKNYQPKIVLKSGFFNYKSDSIQLETSTTNMNYTLNFEQKLKFLNYFSFKNNLGFKGLTSSYNLSRNELVYFGGLKSVRGFYELELVGNNIITVLNEIEYQPISILSFKLIYDYSSFKNNGNFHTNSFGFGFGLLSENSVLEIIIANGIVNSNPLSFSNTKIHIGFSSSF